MVHKAVNALEPIKARADFEVYLKKFLMSLDLILPGAAAHRYRGPARRLGYLMRMTKERFKDDSINFAGVGEKVAAVISKHLIELGVDPKIPPVELLDPDFVEQVTGHAQVPGQRPARWSTPSASTAPSILTRTQPSSSG